LTGQPYEYRRALPDRVATTVAGARVAGGAATESETPVGRTAEPAAAAAARAVTTIVHAPAAATR
jgi:hypothetical protein